MNILEKVDVAKVLEWRRHIHMYPEVAYDEHETAAYIAGVIGGYAGVEILRPTATSVVAVLRGGKPGRVVGLRADIDALPVTEETGLPFASRNAGVMHACGHDCHAAMLLGALDVLHGMRDELCGSVKFIFQHAEEMLPGGACELVASGVLADCEMFFAEHVFPSAPVGHVGVSEGAISANSDRFTIKIQGKGCHAAMPYEGIDTLLVACEVVQSLNFIVSRNVAAKDRAVLTVGALNSGTSFNIVPDTAEIKGTVRTFDIAVQDNIEARISQITQGICAAYGATCEIDYERGYDSMVNDKVAVDTFKRAAQKATPDIIVDPMTPMMGGEDFSAYREIAPICFVEIGAGPPAGGEYFANHHPKFFIDEAAFPAGAALYAAFAIEVLLNE